MLITFYILKMFEILFLDISIEELIRLELMTMYLCNRFRTLRILQCGRGEAYGIVAYFLCQ